MSSAIGLLLVRWSVTCIIRLLNCDSMITVKLYSACRIFCLCVSVHVLAA